MDSTTTCTHCGTIPSPRRPAELWSMAQHDGHREYLCNACARESLVLIENGIDGP